MMAPKPRSAGRSSRVTARSAVVVTEGDRVDSTAALVAGSKRPVIMTIVTTTVGCRVEPARVLHQRDEVAYGVCVHGVHDDGGDAACMVALNGMEALQWSKLCNIYTLFCQQIAVVMLCSLLAGGMGVISVLSARELFRRSPSFSS
jgi:hypothetical protein